MLTAAQLPEVSWDFVYGTNMHHGFMLARQLLARESGTKQIIMITDGEPTAHITADGYVFFNYPPVRETVEATLREVVRCTQGADPDQHVRASAPTSALTRVHREDDQDQRAGRSSRRTRSSATTCWSTSWSADAADAAPRRLTPERSADCIADARSFATSLGANSEMHPCGNRMCYGRMTSL